MSTESEFFSLLQSEYHFFVDYMFFMVCWWLTPWLFFLQRGENWVKWSSWENPNSGSELHFNVPMLLLLSRFSRVRLRATQWTEAHQAPPSLGFSRQEHWRGLPFSSPMHESEKWKWSRSVVSDRQRPHGLQPSRLLRPWDFPGKSTGVGGHRLLHNTA